jgi:hypothetical protein
MNIKTQRTIARNLACALVIVPLAVGCASDNGRQYSTGEKTAIGAGVGAVTGNVIGYLANRDRTTVTVVGTLIGAGIGYWQGMQSDRKLQQAEASSREIADVQSRSRYQYENPKLQARESEEGGQKIATFDKLETPIPYDAVKNRSEDASLVLRKLGALAARNDSMVSVYAPTDDALNYMVDEIRRGAGGTKLSINSRSSKETKVVIGGVPAS